MISQVDSQKISVIEISGMQFFKKKKGGVLPVESAKNSQSAQKVQSLKGYICLRLVSPMKSDPPSPHKPDCRQASSGFGGQV